MPVNELCAKHLLGEHRELHAIWIVITDSRKGYANHPETLRWVGKLGALYERHNQEVEEMSQRGYIHKSKLDKIKIEAGSGQDKFINTKDEQRLLLKAKDCDCYLK